ncbi:MAG: hypothetical protein WDO15_11440 [Bacteroidota bacterium]
MSAWAPSWFPETHVIYTRGKPPITTPKKGDVFGLYMDNMGRIAHAGFIDEWSQGDYCITVEGNTNSAGSP